jgi:hypothetical protein
VAGSTTTGAALVGGGIGMRGILSRMWGVAKALVCGAMARSEHADRGRDPSAANRKGD